MNTEIDYSLPSTYYIFDVIFRVRYPYQASRSAEHIKFYGTPTVGNEDIDREISNQWVDAYITINDMIELYRRGINIQVIDRARTKVIYDYITYHLDSWKRYLSTGINNRAAPLDDLKLMDEFANTIYEHAVWHFKETEHTSQFLKRMRGDSGIDMNNLFTNVVRTIDLETGDLKMAFDKRTAEDKLKDQPQRSSMREFFRSKQLSGVHNVKDENED